MNKSSIILAAALVFGAVFSCTKPEALDLQPAYEYTEAYYEALREYKKSDHSISYLWFADYGVPSSPAYRFAGIPDSVDVVSLWGGIPKEGTLDRKEMYEMRDKKGTKIVAVRITRLAPANANYYSYSWADDAQIPSYVNAYKATYDEQIAAGADEATATTAAQDAGIKALRADIFANPSRTLVSGTEGEDDAVYEYPEWCRYAADDMLNEVFENKLDGYDLDYEPEGDALENEPFITMVQYMAQFLGPKSKNPETLLIIDRNTAPKHGEELAHLCNYWIKQKYGGTGGASAATDSDFPLHNDEGRGWKNNQIIVTENIGDMWKDGGRLLQHAGFQPSKGGRKGGFGAFHGQRDYNTTDSGADKDTPYGHLRKAIQLQNPAVKK